MKSRFLVAYLLIINGMLHAQTIAQPSVAYPFDITLTTPDSTEVSTRQVLAGDQPTVIAFWLTTCAPCFAELAAYTQNLPNWKQQADFRLIAVSIDFPDRFHQFQKVAREKHWPFPVYWDRTRTFKEILPGTLNGLPQVFLFDKKGKLVWQHRKYMPGDEVELFEEIKKVGGKGQ
jgi:peroxiredoxin